MDWTDDWLKTTGPNTLELQMLTDTKGKTKLNILQGTCKYGTKISREQCIGILFFGKGGKQVLLKKIRVEKKLVTENIISQVDSQTVSELEALMESSNMKIPACLVNANNKGLCRTLID